MAAVLEDLEGPFAALDDLLRGDDTAGQSLDFFLDPLEGKEATNIISQELPLHNNTLVVNDTVPVVLDILSPSPPSSPEGLVPDLGLDSPRSSYSPISEPASPVLSSSLTIPSPLSCNNEVFTFIAPVMEPIPMGEVTALSVECPVIAGLGSFTFIVEQPESDISLPEVEMKTKTGRKRKCVDLTSSVSSRSKVTKKASVEKTPSNKRERKRKQNKDAATRYRVKKRVQSDLMLDEEGELQKMNKELKEKKDKIASEISYLKELMREMFKARGLLK